MKYPVVLYVFFKCMTFTNRFYVNFLDNVTVKIRTI